jgi:hypothetical protein
MLKNKEKFVESILDENKLMQRFSVVKNPRPKINCNVLTSKMTELVGCFYSTDLL